jgi:hypothetical protein
LSALAWRPVKCCFWVQVPHAFAMGAFAARTGGAAGAPAGVSGPQMGLGLSFSVSGIWFGTVVNGVVSAVDWNASNIEVPAATFWFNGSTPRICSFVRTIEICE